MVWGSLSDIAFSDAKHLLFGYREQLEKKKIHGSTQKYRTAQKKLLSLESLKKYFFLRKLTKMSNLILCFSEIPELFICVRVREVAFSSEDWKKLSVWSSVLFMVFSLEMPKGKHIENRRDQMCLFFSKRSPLYSMTDLCRFHTLSHDYLQILSPIIGVMN